MPVKILTRLTDLALVYTSVRGMSHEELHLFVGQLLFFAFFFNYRNDVHRVENIKCVEMSPIQLYTLNLL